MHISSIPSSLVSFAQQVPDTGKKAIAGIANTLTLLFDRVIRAVHYCIELPQLAEKKVRYTIGALVGKIVVSGSMMFPKAKMVQTHEHVVHNLLGPNAREVIFKTPDGIALNGIEITNSKEADASLQKWVLFFTPNCGPWENLFCEDLLPKPDNTNLLCYNYRGVSYSEGSPDNEELLLSDARLIVKSLISSGVQPKNIVLQGWSFGGAISATTALDLFHDEGIQVKGLCIDRSFGSLTSVIDKLFRLFGLAGRVARYGKWALDRMGRLDTLPINTLCFYSPRDEVIHLSCSTVHSLKDNPIAERVRMVDSANNHNRPWTAYETALYQAWLKKTLCDE